MDSTPQLFDSVPDALVLVDDAGRIVRANQNAERLFGYPAHGLGGLEVEQLVPQDMRGRHRQHRDGYMRQARVRPMGGANMNLVGQRRDGSQFPVEIALSPLMSGGALCYLASVRDISESQRVRQALVRARYDAVVAEIGQLALASRATEAVIEQIPPRLAEVMQVPRVAALLLRDESLTLGAAVGFAGSEDGQPPAWMQSPGNPVLRALGTGRPILVQDAADPASPAGWPVDACSGVIVPLQDRDRPMGALVALATMPRRFGHDELQLLQTVGNLLAALVQRRRTEEQLAHAQRLEALGQLTGGIAHDFNNLLTVVSGSLQMLEDRYAAHPGARQLIESALRSVGRGAELTTKLLAFARRQHLQPRPVCPLQILEDLTLMLRSTLGDAIRIDQECENGLPPVLADSSQLEAAILNLALNARDAMPDGGRIRIGARERWMTLDATRPERKPGHYVAFSVTDNGQDMSAAVRARALEPFFSTKAVGRGSGLGLSMVYGFVTQSGGYMTIDSQPGRGTQVELYLPATAGGTVLEAPASGDGQPEVARTGRILMVEDQQDVREITVALLEAAGYEVVAVPDASTAMACIERDDIDLLLSDVMLGSGRNGVELALAATAMKPGLRVLLVSGFDDTGAVARGGALPFELLRKPYGREQLVGAVRRLMA